MIKEEGSVKVIKSGLLRVLRDGHDYQNAVHQIIEDGMMSWSNRPLSLFQRHTMPLHGSCIKQFDLITISKIANSSKAMFPNAKSFVHIIKALVRHALLLRNSCALWTLAVLALQ